MLRISLLIVELCILQLVDAQKIHWQPLGEPGSGGAITDIAFSPYDQNHILVAGDVLNAAYSRDGGNTWHPTFGFKSNEIAAFTFHPADSSVIWVGTMSGPYKSMDGGTHWIEKRNGMDPVGSYAYTCPIQKILFDPKDTDRLLAFGGNMRDWNSPGNPKWNVVWESRNGGETWVQFSKAGSMIKPGITNAEYAGNKRIVLSARKQGVFISDDDGKTWKLANTGLPTRDVLWVTVNPKNPSVMYAALNNYRVNDLYHPGGIYISQDGGANWKNSSHGIERTSNADSVLASHFRSIKIAPTNTKILYTSNSGWANSGVYKSIDGGKSWNVILNKSSTGNFPRVFYPQSGPELYAFSIDPSDENTMIGGNWEYVLKTADGGQTWEDIMSDTTLTPGYFKGNGFSGLVASNFEFNPFDPDHAVLQAWDDGKFIQSNDNLESWKSGGKGMWRHNGGNDVSFAGNNGNIIYCTTGQYGFDGVWKTTDRGSTWKHFPLSSFIGAKPDNQPIGIYTLQDHPDIAWVVLADRIYQTLDGGSSWFEIFAAEGMKYIAEDRNNPFTFYVNSTLGVFKTIDGKIFKLMHGSPANGDKIYCVSGDSPALYVTKWRTGNGEEGLWKFDGSDWILLKKDYYIYDVAVHPKNQDILVVSTNDHPYHDVMNNSGISLTIDGGKSWTLQNKNLPMLKGEVIRFNPHQPNQLILGTGGRGFFTGILMD
ncbi:MAG: hypothetical protein K9J30_02685 [Bacteroidales bacterium]|nr:hypothetical protein [Bacteroidales bacterium]